MKTKKILTVCYYFFVLIVGATSTAIIDNLLGVDFNKNGVWVQIIHKTMYLSEGAFLISYYKLLFS